MSYLFQYQGKADPVFVEPPEDVTIDKWQGYQAYQRPHDRYREWLYSIPYEPTAFVEPPSMGWNRPLERPRLKTPREKDAFRLGATVWAGVLEDTFLAPPPPPPPPVKEPPGLFKKNPYRVWRTGTPFYDTTFPAGYEWHVAGLASETCPLRLNLSHYWSLDESPQSGSCAGTQTVYAETDTTQPTSNPPNWKLTRGSTGRLFAAYVRVDGLNLLCFLAYSDDDGATWTEERIDDADTGSGDFWEPSIAIDSTDQIHAVFRGQWGGATNSGTENIMYRRRAADGTWGAQYAVTDRATDQFTPSVAVDSADDVYVVWHGTGRGIEPLVHNIILRKQTAGVWGSEEMVTDVTAPTATEDQTQARIAFDSSDKLWIVWIDAGMDTPFHARLTHRTRTSAGSYGVAGIVVGSDAGGHSLAVDADDRPLVSLVAYSTAPYRVHVRCPTTAGAVIFTSSTPDISSTSLSVDGDNQVHLTWTTSSDIKYATLDSDTYFASAGTNFDTSAGASLGSGLLPAMLWARWPGGTQTILESGYQLVYSQTGAGGSGSKDVIFNCDSLEAGGTGDRLDSIGSVNLDQVGAVATVPGWLGGSALFAAGDDSFLEATDNTALYWDDRSFTFAVWIQPSSIGTLGGILGRWDDSADKEYLLALEASGEVTWQLKGGVTTTTVTSNITLVAGRRYLLIPWHDPVADEIHLEIWSSGIATDAVSASHTTGTDLGTTSFKIGAYTDGATIHEFDGLINEVAAYDRLLTATERELLFQDGAGATLDQFCSLELNRLESWLPPIQQPRLLLPVRPATFTVFVGEPSDFPAEEDVTVDKWFVPLQTPPKGITPRPEGLIAFVDVEFPGAETETVDMWYRPIEQPIFLPLPRQHLPALLPLATAAVPPLDSYYRQLVTPEYRPPQRQQPLGEYVFEPSLFVRQELAWLPQPPVIRFKPPWRPMGEYAAGIDFANFPVPEGWEQAIQQPLFRLPPRPPGWSVVIHVEIIPPEQTVLPICLHVSDAHIVNLCVADELVTCVDVTHSPVYCAVVNDDACEC